MSVKGDNFISYKICVLIILKICSYNVVGRNRRFDENIFKGVGKLSIAFDVCYSHFFACVVQYIVQCVF